MKFFKTTLVSISLASIVLSGCASSLTGDSYDRYEARQGQDVILGTIVSLRPVKIEGTKTGSGAVVGGLAGGVAGSAIGHGRGSILGGIAGAAIGSLAGAAVEEGVTKSDGVEITVRLDDTKKLRAYVQQVDKNVTFRNGQRVRVLVMSNGTSRVVPN